MNDDHNGRYILDDNHNPVPEPDLLKWAKWFHESGPKRRVAHDTKGNCSVSTVFLGLDHSFGSGPPLLFETMVFGSKEDIQERYSTWDEALAGHKRILEEAC